MLFLHVHTHWKKGKIMNTVIFTATLALMCSMYTPKTNAYTPKTNATAFSDANAAILLPIKALFDGMREHDAEKVLAQFMPEALLHRVKTDGSVKKNSLTEFAGFVSKSTTYLDEQIFGLKIQQQGNLATVWAPFVFYAGNKVSHCGVNSFQLVKGNKKWKIQSLIDNTFKGNCEDFRLKVKSALTAQ